MHTTLIAALSIAVFASAPLGAQTPTSQPAPTLSPKTLSSAQADAKVDAALESAKKKLIAGDKDPAPSTEFTEGVKGSFPELAGWTPSLETIRTRLINAINDIYARAAKAQIQAEELEILRIEALDARLENAIAKATAQAAADPTSVNLQQVTDHLTALVEAAKAKVPAMQDFQKRAKAIVDELVKKARIAVRDLDPLRVEVSASRAERSTALLEMRAVAKSAVDQDFTRAKYHITDHMGLLAKTDPSVKELQDRLILIIDGLAKRAPGATLTRADFTDLKAQFVARARTAAATK